MLVIFYSIETGCVGWQISFDSEELFFEAFLSISQHYLWLVGGHLAVHILNCTVGNKWRVRRYGWHDASKFLYLIQECGINIGVDRTIFVLILYKCSFY